MLHLHPYGRSLPNHTLNAQINNDGESHTGMCKATTRFTQVLQIAKKKDDNDIEMNKLMGHKMDNLSLNSSTFPYYNSMITE